MVDNNINKNFETWKQDNPNFMKTIVFLENKRWGRVLCKWNEIVNNGESKIEHIYAAAIDLKNGDIYLDCRPRKLWAKCCLYSLIQPIILTAKTVYHLALPISIPYTIYKTVQKAREGEESISGKELTKRIFKEIGKNTVDIVRTPLYAIALTTLGVAGVIIGPFAPKILYDIRATASKVEKSLHWGETDSGWILFHCFQPRNNVMTINTTAEFPYTEYINKDDEFHKGLTKFARSQIIYRRNTRALFNDCLHLYPENKPYISKATPPKVSEK